MSEGIDSKELRYAKSLMDRGEKAKAKRIITDIIENSKDDNTVAEAMYCQVLWKFASDERDTFEKLKAYYPNSKYTRRLEAKQRRIEAEREAERRRIEAKREAERRRIEAEKEAERRRIEAEKEEKRRRIEAERNEFLASFIDRGNSIVLDTKTGLEWLAGPDRDTTWYEAISWVANLTVAGGGWRIPTRKELETLYKHGVGTRNMTPLLETTGTWVWSCQRSSDLYQYTYNFSYGEYYDSTKRTRPKNGRVFAVRSRR